MYYEHIKVTLAFPSDAYIGGGVSNRQKTVHPAKLHLGFYHPHPSLSPFPSTSGATFAYGISCASARWSPIRCRFSWGSSAGGV